MFPKLSKLKYYSLSFNTLPPSTIVLSDDKFANLDLPFDYFFFSKRKIYVFVLLESFIRKPSKTLKEINHNYLSLVIKKLSPKLVIFHDLSFFHTPLSKKRTIVVYQHNCVFSINSLYSQLGYSTQSKLSCDYFLVFNEGQKKLYESKIDGDIRISGSVKSNCNVLERTNNLYDILFISQYRDPAGAYFDCWTQLVVLINEYVVNNKMKLGIAYNSKRTDKDRKAKIEVEVEYFKRNINLIDDIELNSYEKAAKSEVVVCIDSNLGIELLSHGYKVVFINVTEAIHTEKRLPHFSEPRGYFWTTAMEYDEISRVINNVYEMSRSEWSEYLNTHHKDLLTGDKNNKVIYEIIDTVMTDTKK